MAANLLPAAALLLIFARGQHHIRHFDRLKILFSDQTPAVVVMWLCFSQQLEQPLTNEYPRLLFVSSN
jgi:hypothetical protein